MKNLVWNIGLAVALAAGTAFTSGCKSEAKGQGAAQQAPPPPAVTIATVATEEIVEWDELVGRTAAVEMVEVRPRVSGHLMEVRFQAGQTVKKGDILFVIDPRWHKAEHDRAAAEFERAKVRMEIAQREATRSTQLLSSKAISLEESDAREARLAEAKAAILSAEAALNSVKLDLEYTEVRAPITGKISRALLTPGNYITGVPGFTTVLATIVTVDPMYVYTDVDENTLLKFNGLRRGGKIAAEKVAVEMAPGDSTEFVHKGEIESFDNHVDEGTGSILLRSVFPNPNGELLPGLFVRMRIPGSAKYDAVLIDERAISTDQNRKFVLTLSATNTVEYRAVDLGPSMGGRRIIRKGLQAGDKIVVNGLQKVRPGMPVTPEFAKPTNVVSTAKN